MHPKDLDDYEFGHWPDLIYDGDDQLGQPMEVCGTCSDTSLGLWVPASFCPDAKEKMLRKYERETNA